MFKKLMKAVFVIATVTILSASAFAQANQQPCDFGCLLSKYSQVEGERDRFQNLASATEGERDRLMVENGRLATELGRADREKGELEQKLQNLQSLNLNGEADLIRRGAVKVTARDMAQNGQKVMGLENQVERNFQQAGMAPVVFLVADCGEGDWKCDRWMKGKKELPDRSVYPTVMVVPSYSSSGLTSLPEERQAALAQQRGQVVGAFYRAQGYQVSVGASVEGRSGALLLFMGVGVNNSSRLERLERELFHTQGLVDMAIERIVKLESRMDKNEAKDQEQDQKIEELQRHNRIGDWGLGLGLSWTGAKSGPSLWSVEGNFVGHLRMNDWANFSFMAGPGVGFVGGKAHAVLSEFIGVQFHKSWFAVDVGLRHRVAFLGDGDSLNALMGEVNFGFLVANSVDLGLGFGLGKAWFPKTEKVGMSAAGMVQPTKIVVGSGITGTVLIRAGYRF